jgi:DNA-binding HxlR family transcriptional regulator
MIVKAIAISLLATKKIFNLRYLRAPWLITFKGNYPEVPPHTEYSLTGSGKKLVEIIRQIRLLDTELGRGTAAGSSHR